MASSCVILTSWDSAVCVQRVDAVEVSSLHPFVHHCVNALPGHNSERLIQKNFVGLGVGDFLNFIFLLALGIGLEKYRQGKGIGLDFDQVGDGHGWQLNACSHCRARAFP